MSLAIMSRLIDSFPAVHIVIGMLYSSCWRISCWTKVTEQTDFASEMAKKQRRNDTLISTSTLDQMFLYLYLHLSIISTPPSLLHFPCNPFFTFCSHPPPLFPDASFYQGEWLWEADFLAPQAWSLIQRDQRLATQHLFRTMSLPACQQQVVRLAGRSGEALVPVAYKECQPFTCTRN